MPHPPTLAERSALMRPHEAAITAHTQAVFHASVAACPQCANHWRLIEAIDAWYWGQVEACAQRS